MVRLTPTRLLCAAILLCTFFLASSVFNLLFGERGYDLLLERPPHARAHPGTTDVHFGTECSPFTAGVMDDVTIVLKMGAGEAQTELPTYLNRLGRCKQDLLLFSDRKTIYNGFDIVDALGNIRPEYKYRNLDFDIYDRIQTANTTEEISHEGYKLDKYKLLPMMELAAHLRPQSRWFVFLDMDTYVNWDNLYRFLTAFNPQLPYYFGSPMWPKKKTVYAHGGSGFILSRGAMNKLMARGRMFAENHHFPGTHFFGEDLTKQTYGDEVLAQVLKKSGVPIRGYWPMFNGEKPISVRFGNEQWCEAILTMHHLQEDDFTSLAHWEASRSHPNRPLTFEELFTFIESQIREKVDDWSNMSDDVIYKKGNRAARSFQDCANACLKDSKCLQYEHAGDTCRLSHVIRLGRHQDPDGDKKWTSGWMVGRIKKFKAARSPCQGAHFVHSNP